MPSCAPCDLTLTLITHLGCILTSLSALDFLMAMRMCLPRLKLRPTFGKYAHSFIVSRITGCQLTDVVTCTR